MQATVCEHELRGPFDPQESDEKTLFCVIHQFKYYFPDCTLVTLVNNINKRAKKNKWT